MAELSLYATFDQRVQHAVETKDVCERDARAIVRREDFERAIWRADTRHEMQQILVDMLPYIDFRDK